MFRNFYSNLKFPFYHEYTWISYFYLILSLWFERKFLNVVIEILWLINLIWLLLLTGLYTRHKCVKMVSREKCLFIYICSFVISFIVPNSPTYVLQLQTWTWFLKSEVRKKDLLKYLVGILLRTRHKFLDSRIIFILLVCCPDNSLLFWLTDHLSLRPVLPVRGAASSLLLLKIMLTSSLLPPPSLSIWREIF